MSTFGRKEKMTDKVAEAHGFVSEKPVIGRRRRNRGPTRALNINMPEAEFARFIQIADKIDKTYAETLVELMDKFDV